MMAECLLVAQSGHSFCAAHVRFGVRRRIIRSHGQCSCPCVTPTTCRNRRVSAGVPVVNLIRLAIG